ncbi:MAG: flagellar biosynthesis protein FlhA [Burkholderiales bacterium]|nr:flagellar biosynthesis protein FlhA [Burkholderiales bacterium]
MSAALGLTAAWRGFPLRGLAAPAFIVMVLAMMILPLPPLLLDLLFTFNIALGLIVLLAAVYANRPMDFAAFPTVLLLTTLLRLSLNIASTRVVLLHGHTGPDAAGKVIEAFGHFLVGGNFAVGIVVFLILVVINFVVITKGAGRIAEVSARFTLDAMPGKQMAIDADMNAGLISEQEARKRRAEIAREADFYGAMDGASKFVRGDAIAGILILAINVIGGFAIGMLQHDLPAKVAVDNYVLLAIGDGLVAQIPALVISVAAGLVVSRVGGDEDVREDIGTQVVRQLVMHPQTLMVTGGVLGLLGLIPGMPHFAFMLFGGAGIWLGWRQSRAARSAAVAEAAPPQAEAESGEASWEDLAPVDVLGLEVGYRLIPLVDRNQDGDLLKRIKAIRRKFAQEVGFLPPQVHIRDNLELKPNGYRVSLKGVVIGEGEVYAGMFMAINPGGASAPLPGASALDPAFGLPATWIEGALRDQALSTGYTVVDAGTVVATHLNHLMQGHAAALLGRVETQALVEHLNKHAPKLIDDLMPKLVPLATLTRVLQGLLEEGVHIRDLRTIVETMTEHATRTPEPAELLAQVRIALGRAVLQGIFGPSSDVEMLVLEPDLERVLAQAATGAAGDALGIEPGLAENLARDLAAAAQRLENLGQPPALLVPDKLRPAIARMTRRTLPRLRVLSHAEIPESCTIRVAALVGARGGLPA